MRWGRAATIIPMVLAGLALTAPGGAQLVPDEDACLRSFRATQQLRAAGKLVQARSEVHQCMRSDCLPVVSAKCSEWFRELEREIPTVLVKIVDDEGRATLHATLSIDGEPAPGLLRGIAQPLDPGDHLVRVELPNGKVLERRIAVLQGQKNEMLELRFPLAPPPPAAPEPRPPPAPEPADDDAGGLHPAAWVGFGLGAAGLIAGAITGGWALSKGAECQDSGCTADEISTGGRVADVSTASFIVGAVGVGAGITLMLIDRSEPSPAQSGARDLRIGISSAAGEVGVGVKGRF